MQSTAYFIQRSYWCSHFKSQYSHTCLPLATYRFVRQDIRIVTKIWTL